MNSLKNNQHDFSQGSISKAITRLALPYIGAQLLNALYNVVDRVFIGHIPGDGRLALTGVGLGFPLIMIVAAFSGLFGTGGAPLCSIARGAGENEKAERIMCNSFTLLIITGIVLPALCIAFMKPLMYAFGASDATYPYAADYMTVYLSGSIFVMIALGMNPYIQSQGFAMISMITVTAGAVLNTALDPLFIYVFKMGVTGAALATIIAQFVSAVWVFRFLTGKKAILRLSLKAMKLDFGIIKKIVSLGVSNFIMSVTNSAVAIVCNSALKRYGGDIYVGVMTVISSVKNIVFMPIQGFTNSAQPVMGFNYGAKQYDRVRQCIKFTICVAFGFATVIWLFMLAFPGTVIKIFNSDPELVRFGKRAVRIYFGLYISLAFQMCGQTTFVALGKSKQAIFFSLLRKVFLVIPLVYLLPGMFGMGVDGVFASEPISEIVGGGACFLTMMLTLWPKLKNMEPGVTG